MKGVGPVEGDRAGQAVVVVVGTDRHCPGAAGSGRPRAWGWGRRPPTRPSGMALTNAMKGTPQEHGRGREGKEGGGEADRDGCEQPAFVSTRRRTGERAAGDEGKGGGGGREWGKAGEERESGKAVKDRGR